MFTNACDNLNLEQSRVVAELFSEYSDIFSVNDFDIGCYKGYKHHVDTGNEKPYCAKLRRIPLGMEEVEDRIIKEMLKAGVIRRSQSEWAFSPVMVKKKDGSFRYAIDFRPLNRMSKNQTFPISNIEQCLDTCAGHKFFSCLDFTSAYWNIELTEESIPKCSFINRLGQWEFVKMPFGLKSAGFTYSRVMFKVLEGMLFKEVCAYLDDVVTLGRTFEHAFSILKEVFGRLREAGLKLKPRKCKFFQQEILFLGRKVTEQGISINPSGYDVLKDWEEPNSVKETESFLGFMNYHRSFIKNHAQIATPLHELTGPKAKFKWEKRHQEAFDGLKQAMMSAPTLGFPDPNLPFILDCDASDYACGAELSQEDEDGNVRVIAFGSKAFTKEQRNYCVTRKELLAIVEFTKLFRHYLLANKFVVRTDHRAITWLHGFREVDGQLARWLARLETFDMEIQHRPGSKHVNADFLSRPKRETNECVHHIPNVKPKELPCGGCHFCTKKHNDWGDLDDDDDVMAGIRRIRATKEGTGMSDPSGDEKSPSGDPLTPLRKAANPSGNNISRSSGRKRKKPLIRKPDPTVLRHPKPPGSTKPQPVKGNRRRLRESKEVWEALNKEVKINGREKASKICGQRIANKPKRHVSQSQDIKLNAIQRATVPSQQATQSISLNALSAKELREIQLKDTELSILIEWMERDHPPTVAEVMIKSRGVRKFWLTNNLLEMREGVLYYRWLNTKLETERLLLMVPQTLRNNVMEAFHCSSAAGHPGIQRTVLRVRQGYMWYGMRNDCERFVRNCVR